MQHKIALAVTVAGALALSACSKKPPEELPPAPQNTATPVPPPSQPAGPVPGSQEHFRQAMAGQDTIYFDTDMFNVDAEDQAALRQQANYLAQYANARATIEGHADERGTREYNLALGERRANAAKNYLVSLGVAADRLSTVSYGKERPVAVGSNEEAWARNRRAVTVVMN
jgi:peptidoglycan-associated lipoprotein